MCGEPIQKGIFIDCGKEYASSGTSLETQLCEIGEIVLIIGIIGLVIYLVMWYYKKKIN